MKTELLKLIFGVFASVIMGVTIYASYVANHMKGLERRG